MSLGSIPLLNALPVQQLNVDPRLGGRVEPIIQMNNDSIGTTLVPNDVYTIKVLRSSDPQAGHMFMEHTNGSTNEKTVYLQYDKTQKHLSVPQAQKFISPAHEVTSSLTVAGSATILGSLTVAGGFTPVITSLASLNVNTLRNTQMTSLNANVSNLVGVNANIQNITCTTLTTDNLIANTLISNLTVDNFFGQDNLMTNLSVVSPIVGTLQTFPSAYNALTITNLVADNLTNINANLSNVVAVDAQIHHVHSTHLTTVNAYIDNLTLVNDLNITNLNTSNLTVLNNAELKNVNAFSLSLLDDLKLPINSAEFLKTSSNGFVQSGNFSSVTAGNATNAVNVQRYSRVWYASPAGSGDGNFSNPCNFATALLFAKAYADENPSHYQAIYLNVGEYGNAGVVFTVDVPRLSIIGMSESKGAVKIVEGLNYTISSAFDADNEYNMICNVSVFNQATAGVNCINYVPTAKMYLTVKNCFVFATGNFHAINAQPTDLASRLYLDGSELSADGTQETIHIRRGILWQCSRSAISSKSTAPALRVSNFGVVSAIDNSVFASTYAVVNAQSVISFDVVGNFIISNSTIQGASANTDLTGIDITNNAGVLVANNLQVAVYGTGAGASKALRGTGAGSILYSNQNNALGVSAAGQNVAQAGFIVVNQTKV